MNDNAKRIVARLNDVCYQPFTDAELITYRFSRVACDGCAQNPAISSLATLKASLCSECLRSYSDRIYKRWGRRP